MNVVQDRGELHEYWTSLLPDDQKDSLPGTLFLVADLLVAVPEWARWKMVQPDGRLVLAEDRPHLSRTGWVIPGRQWTDGGLAEVSPRWRETLDMISYSPSPVSAPSGLYTVVHQMRKIIPDNTRAITMEADGAIFAWAHIPDCMDGTWFGRNGDTGQLVGWHANPARFNHRACLIVSVENGELNLLSPLQ